MDLADSFFVGCAVLAFCIYFGHWVDTVINRALPGNSGRSEAPSELVAEPKPERARLFRPAWWRLPWGCKFDMHPGMHRINIYLGDGGPPPSCYCPRCGERVGMARLKGAGWYEHRIYGKTWQRGPNMLPQPGIKDMREVYWQEDPIETRVVRSGPHPGTTGDIKPDDMLDPNVSADEVWANPRQYGPQVKLGWSTEGRKAGFTYDERNDMVDKAIETGDISPLLEPELCCWCGLPFVSANGTVMCHRCMEHFRV